MKIRRLVRLSAMSGTDTQTDGRTCTRAQNVMITSD